MKMNKKLIVVPFLSTVVGLSLAGGIGGAFAWYQYNSQVTASFIGTSVADSHLLQIGTRTGGSGTDQDPYTYNWGRDYIRQGSLTDGKCKLVPVTFGELLDQSGQEGGKKDVLGATAYGYPEAGKQVADNYSSWATISPNNGYVQFEVYLKATKADKTQAALDVFLSDVHIEGVGENADDAENPDPTKKAVSDAVRIHLAVEGTDPNRLISKKKVTDMNLYGPLDLDGDNQPDTVGGYAWGDDRDNVITYGKNGDTQSTLGINDIVVQRDAQGRMPTSTSPNYSKKICTTKTTGVVKITVTCWLEGWAKLKTTNQFDDPNTDTVDESKESAVWNPEFSAGLDVRVGLTFDVGRAE